MKREIGGLAYQARSLRHRDLGTPWQQHPDGGLFSRRSMTQTPPHLLASITSGMADARSTVLLGEHELYRFTDPRRSALSFPLLS
jgi:hypothetical protein